MRQAILPAPRCKWTAARYGRLGKEVRAALGLDRPGGPSYVVISIRSFMRNLLFLALSVSLCAQQAARDYPVKPVPFTSVHFNDVFWAPRIDINRTVTIPFAVGKNEETGRVDNFVRAATALRGETLANKKAPGYPFDDSDV